LKKDHYIYPAILTFAEDGISIEFPDLQGCLPSASNIDEAIKNAKEAMALHLYGMEEGNLEIPDPSPVNKLKLESDQMPLLVEAYMPLYRDAIANKSMNKTLTIPQWLNVAGETNGINFSQVLQAALKEKLGING